MSNTITSDDVRAIRRMLREGWGIRTIAREMGFARGTVRRYARQFGHKPDAKGAMHKVSLPGLSNREKHLLSLNRAMYAPPVDGPLIRAKPRQAAPLVVAQSWLPNAPMTEIRRLPTRGDR